MSTICVNPSYDAHALGRVENGADGDCDRGTSTGETCRGGDSEDDGSSNGDERSEHGERREKLRYFLN